MAPDCRLDGARVNRDPKLEMPDQRSRTNLRIDEAAPFEVSRRSTEADRMILKGIPPDHQKRAAGFFKTATSLVPAIARRGSQECCGRAKRTFECRFAKLGQFNEDNLENT